MWEKLCSLFEIYKCMCMDVSLFKHVKDKSTKSLKAFYHSSEDQELTCIGCDKWTTNVLIQNE